MFKNVVKLLKPTVLRKLSMINRSFLSRCYLQSINFLKLVFRMTFFSLILIAILSGVYLGNIADGMGTTEPKCNHSDHSNPLFDNKTLNEIDDLLDKVYSHIITNVSYEVDCTFGVHFPTENDTIELVVLLEGLEVRRNRYLQGLWGYCAKEGAEALKADLGILIDMAKKAEDKKEPFGICDRDNLFFCHPKHRKCQCLVDNKNFRNYASEWWDDNEERDDSDEKVGKSFCGLIIGSDCPNGTEDSMFQCIPGLSCRLKSNTSVICSEPGNGTVKRDLEEQNYSTSSTSTTTSTPAITTEKAKVRRKRQTKANGTNRYRFIRHDIGNVHCQCFGYTGGSATGFKHIDKLSDKIMFKKIISQSFFVAMFYIFNLL